MWHTRQCVCFAIRNQSVLSLRTRILLPCLSRPTNRSDNTTTRPHDHTTTLTVYLRCAATRMFWNQPRCVIVFHSLVYVCEIQSNHLTAAVDLNSIDCCCSFSLCLLLFDKQQTRLPFERQQYRVQPARVVFQRSSAGCPTLQPVTAVQLLCSESHLII